MNEQSVGQLLDALIESYPNTRLGDKAMVFYTTGLKELDAEGVWEATLTVSRRTKWPPTVAEIREEYYRQHGVLTGDVSWAAVLAAVKKGAYGNYSKLDDLTRAAMAAIGGRRWCG